MRLMGERGQTVMSVDDAYNALGAPRDAVDDGLIM
jgi:ubiquitin carboxyl-terminal hydrolase 25/28